MLVIVNDINHELASLPKLPGLDQLIPIRRTRDEAINAWDDAGLPADVRPARRA